MTKNEAIIFFGDASKLARVIKISPHAIYQWPKKIPARCQWPIALASSWTLLPDEDLLPAGMDETTLRNADALDDERVSKLLYLGKSLAAKNKTEILDALIVMAAAHA